MPTADNPAIPLALPPLALSVRQACAQLSISRSTLYEEIAAGRLLAKKIGKKTLIPTSAARAWLDTLPAKARACR